MLWIMLVHGLDVFLCGGRELLAGTFHCRWRSLLGDSAAQQHHLRLQQEQHLRNQLRDLMRDPMREQHDLYGHVRQQLHHIVHRKLDLQSEHRRQLDREV